jgi:hypothetical protein
MRRKWPSALAFAPSLVLILSCASPDPVAPASATFVDALPQKGLAAKLVSDATGRLHAAFTEPAFAPGPLGVWYSTCAAGCSAPEAWSSVRVGDAGTQGGAADLAVDGQGRVRLAWLEQSVGVSRFATAGCEGDCGLAAGWTAQQPLWSVASSLPSSGYLASGPGGALGLAFRDLTAGHAGLYFSTCAAACSDPGSWNEVLLPGSSKLQDPELTWDLSGRARLAAHDVLNDAVAFLSCDSACGEATGGGLAANWSDPAVLYSLGVGGSFALRADADGRPRLALAQGDLGAGNPGGFVFLAFCDSGCTAGVGAAGSGWGAHTLGLPVYSGANGVDLALGEGGKVLLAFGRASSGTEVGLATCTTGCTTFVPVWTQATVESAAQLAVAAARPVPAGYDGAGWLTVGRAPSVALDSAGVPWLAYGAEHARWKTAQLPDFEYDELRVRVAKGR